VAANTPIDLAKFQQDLEALTQRNETQLLSVSVMSRHFENGYIGTYTEEVEQNIGWIRWTTAYVGTAGIHLARVFAPNGYNGAGPEFARFTQFDATGKATSGFGPEYVMTSDSHSSYNALQTSVSGTNAKIGLNFAASYTFSKSIDDTSAVLGGLAGGAGAILQTFAQNPLDERAEKGVSTFDVRHVFSVSVFQALPFDKVSFVQPVSRYVTGGWQLLNITSILSGPPFTVYSGQQQTAAGAGGADRPDLLTMPDFSTSRTRREDYFGLGDSNHTLFLIPDGRFGTLGRDTFRGPGYKQFDFALIKNTPFGRRGKSDLGMVEFRAEVFNAFNVVNFGLPSNTVRGTGFGIIAHTAGSSRQVQFSLKMIF